MSEESVEDKPDWWIRNEQDRESLGLPEYDPPKFEDDVYVHEVVNELEEQFDCSIQILGVGTDYLDEWEVRLEGETVFDIGRFRNENGNTVYKMPSSEFRERITGAAKE